uniref:Uncharacterized protein n=1 Tax=Anguilla anguilla TaxID=7936 RepID=A0A0E9WB27_ANGAN
MMKAVLQHREMLFKCLNRAERKQQPSTVSAPPRRVDLQKCPAS